MTQTPNANDPDANDEERSHGEAPVEGLPKDRSGNDGGTPREHAEAPAEGADDDEDSSDR